MQTQCYVADSPRLGPRKILICGEVTRAAMSNHLHAAYSPGAQADFGSALTLEFRWMDEDMREPESVTGEYVAMLYDPGEPDNFDHYVAERICVRKAAFWERLFN